MHLAMGQKVLLGYCWHLVCSYSIRNEKQIHHCRVWNTPRHCSMLRPQCLNTGFKWWHAHFFALTWQQLQCAAREKIMGCSIWTSSTRYDFSALQKKCTDGYSTRDFYNIHKKAKMSQCYVQCSVPEHWVSYELLFSEGRTKKYKYCDSSPAIINIFRGRGEVDAKRQSLNSDILDSVGFKSMS